MNNHNFSNSRRGFLKSGIMLAASIPALQYYPLSGNGLSAKTLGNTPDDGDRLLSIFRNPPVTSKPFVRWWWNGDKLSAKEILRELDVMKEAGIGGVEINPIAFPGGDDLSIPSLPWLSNEWIEMVKVALKGAEERGMVCDTIVGSGWPFGAEFLEQEERSQVMTIASRKVQGSATVTLSVEELLKEAAPQGMSMYKGGTSEIHSLCLAPVQMDKFTAPKWLPYDNSKNEIQINVPAGEYILYALVKVTGFQAVINGAPGAAGPVLNHYSTQAVLKFLNRMSDKLFPAIAGLKPFRAMFCDSFELEGANWCTDMTDEFKRRRGYDVTPYLPFILYKVGHMGHPVEGGEITRLSGTAKEEISRVRYDFFVNCMDVMTDRFLIPYTQWCNKHGFKSRVQAYGRELHPLEASMHIDIPECETWLRNANRDLSKEDSATCVNKYVSSAAHYTGKKLVSCEESTNTDAVFNATLESLKLVGDMSNLSGVTHSILHGFNYSPLEAPFPGWIRYGMFLNERNTWWPHFKLWAAYKSRVSAILQETEAFADIAILHPLADMWTIHGPQRDPFPGLHYPPYQYRVWEGIHRNGNSCDYTSENIIQQSKAENGFLKYKSRKYHTLILLEVETIAPATATALSGFAAKGGKVIFVGKEPHKSSGLKNYAQNDKKVAQAIVAMKKANPSRVFTVEAPGSDIVAWFGKIQQQCGIRPYMSIEKPNDYVSQIRHQGEGKDIFFVNNCSQHSSFTLKASFPGSKGIPSLWNAETGERSALKAAAGNTLTLDLQPASAQFIVFDTLDKGAAEKAAVSPQPAAQPGHELTEWTLRMEHINGTVQEYEVSALPDIVANEKTRSFAGYLYYETQAGRAFSWLDLGKVCGVSELSINGEPLGVRWYGRHLYHIPEHLVTSGKKTVTIKITTTLGNYFKSNPNNKVGHQWTARQNWQQVGLLGPVKML